MVCENYLKRKKTRTKRRRRGLESKTKKRARAQWSVKLREAEENRRFLECREVFYFYFVCVCVLGVLNFVVSLARARKVKT